MNKRLRWILPAVVAVSIGVYSSSSILRADSLRRESPPQTPKIDTHAMSPAHALADAFKQVARAVEPAVVNIRAVKQPAANENGGIPEQLRRFFPDLDGDGRPDVPEGFRIQPFDNSPALGEGSGVIVEVDGDTGYIVTNNHVAGDASKLTVVLHDGRVIDNVEVVGTDPKTDVAVLKINAADLVAAKWGRSDQLEKGDIVFAFGSPFGYVGSMSQGIVSGLNRQAGMLGEYGYDYWIQTDAAINPGNSGGPLVNLNGEIVGINTAIASRTGAFNGIGFSIPSDQVKYVYDALRHDGRVTRGWLGVEIMDVTNPALRVDQLGYKGRTGVYVRGSMRGAPAFGKLQPEDIITHIDGKPVENMQQLRMQIARLKPGERVTLTVFRNRENKEVSITLGEQPETGEKVAQQAAPSETSIGLRLRNATPDQLEKYDLPKSTRGAVVSGVTPNSPAAMSGVEEGMVIIRVNDTDVEDAQQAVDALKKAEIKDGIRLIVVDADGTKAIVLRRND